MPEDLSQLQIVHECARVGLAATRAYNAARGAMLSSKPSSADFAQAHAKVILMADRGEDVTPKDLHELYALKLLADGKPAPDPWDQLSEHRQIADAVFLGTVKALFFPS